MQAELAQQVTLKFFPAVSLKDGYFFIIFLRKLFYWNSYFQCFHLCVNGIYSIQNVRLICKGKIRHLSTTSVWVTNNSLTWTLHLSIVLVWNFCIIHYRKTWSLQKSVFTQGCAAVLAAWGNNAFSIYNLHEAAVGFYDS